MSTTIFSNEMKIGKTKESWESSKFHVMTGNKSWSVDGSWKEIKEQMAYKGGKLTINAYVAIKVDGVLRLACVQFNGASYAPWKDFHDANDGSAIHSKVIKVVDHEYAKKGSNEFNTPVFAFLKSPLTEETTELCIEYDKTLQEYLKAKQKQHIQNDTTQEEDKPVQIDEPVKTNLNTRSNVDAFEEEPVASVNQGVGLDDDGDDMPF